MSLGPTGADGYQTNGDVISSNRDCETIPWRLAGLL